MQPWLADSGTNAHVTPDLGQLTNHCDYHGGEHINDVLGGTPDSTYTLPNTLFFPHASSNILSINQFCVDDFVCKIWTPGGSFSRDQVRMASIHSRLVHQPTTLVLQLSFLMFVSVVLFGTPDLVIPRCLFFSI